MIEDGRTIPDGTVLDADVAIIGTGAAGSILARELDEAGLRVIVLEAGDAKLDLALQDPMKGELPPQSLHPATDLFRRRQLGGATAAWGGRCVPYDPIDFEPRDWVPGSAWPFGPEALAPHLDAAARHLEIGRPVFTVRDSLGEAAPPLLEGFRHDLVSTDTLERFSRPTNLGLKHRDAFANSTRLRLLLRSTVVAIETDSTGADEAPVTALRVATSSTHGLRVHARAYVLAAGGLDTTRLLLASDTSRRGGLGNASGQLGRNYMCHIESTFGVLRLQPGSRGVQTTIERDADGIYLARKFALTDAAQREHRLLNGIFRLHYPLIADPGHGHPILSAMYLVKDGIMPEYRRKLATVERLKRDSLKRDVRFWARHVGNVAASPLTIATFGIDWVRRRNLASRKIPFVMIPSREGAYPLDFNFEQAPNPDSRVTLAATRDAFGMPRVHVDWRIGRTDLDSMQRTLALVQRVFAETGTARFDYDATTIEAELAASPPVGGHHIGTARMATNPREGVVDPDGRVFGTPGLYLAGSAPFPSSSFANPTLTIAMMALRLAAHLRQSLDRSEPSRRAAEEAA